jgi:Flp pilus assembly protein TadD
MGLFDVLNRARYTYHKNRAHEKFGQGDLPGAAAVLTKLIGLMPDVAETWADRGVVPEQLGRWEDAANDSSRAVELEPGLARGWFGRGNAYLRLGRLDEGVADYSRAVELEPAWAEAWENRGAARVLAGKATPPSLTSRQPSRSIPRRRHGVHAPGARVACQG